MEASHAGRAVPAPERVDEYQLVELLGRGGMGTVYRARDTLLDRDVAIKLIARASSDLARQRFLVEARAVARIRHANVVVVHRVGVSADRPYIVYDLVDGITVDDLRRPLAWPKAVDLAVGIARGLAAAHACGVLHRDLKPANLMLDGDGDVVLVDFGLAKLDDAAAPAPASAPIEPAAIAVDAPITVTGVAMGTPRYMAPEAWRGLPATAQTDLYSFGVVLYELLAGRSPFADTGAALLAARVCSEDPAPLAEVAPWVPAALCALVDRCVARDPACRPPTAAAVGDELEAIQRGRAFELFERDRAERLPAGSPYPGARPYEFEQSGVFFGRRRELLALIELLRARPFVAITGEPGAGKTSLCRAGLLPIIVRGALGGARKWVPMPMTPGTSAIAALADVVAQHVERPRDEVEDALRTAPGPVLDRLRAGHRGGCAAHVLFVDPLDDLVGERAPHDAAAFAALLARLAEPAPAFRVIATVRAGNLARVAQLPGLGAVVSDALYLVVEPRDRVALYDIVREPGRLAGRALPAETVDALVAAAARGELPLAQLAARLADDWRSAG